MKFAELIINRPLRDALKANAPASKYSGQPLTLVNYTLNLGWENCMEKDWWVGQDDGIYTRQDRRTVTDEEIIRASEIAGLNLDEVHMAIAGRGLEQMEIDALNKRQSDAYFAEQAEKTRQLLSENRAKQLERFPSLGDTAIAAAAEKEIAELLAAHPRVERMTRKLDLVDEREQKLATFTNREGMLAWLFQRGHRASIDDRQIFVDAAK